MKVALVCGVPGDCERCGEEFSGSIRLYDKKKELNLCADCLDAAVGFSASQNAGGIGSTELGVPEAK